MTMGTGSSEEPELAAYIYNKIGKYLEANQWLNSGPSSSLEPISIPVINRHF